jgi:purine-nucleoside phosphorylase
VSRLDDYDRAAEAAEAVRQRTGGAARVAIVLGSGLGGVADVVARPIEIAYAELPHWPVPHVAGHEGRLVAGTVQGRAAIVLAGRCHGYEGHTPSAVAFGVRVLGVLGVRTVVLTNAAGGINPAFSAGALMVIDDHINLTATNPLVGPHDARVGPRFPDMSEVYARRLRDVADRAGRDARVPLLHGVYAGVSGPNYETPAEVRYLRAIGADAVGMSTVVEAIAARHMGLEVLGLSCIANMAAGVLPGLLDHADVLAASKRAQGQIAALIEHIVALEPIS